MGKPLMYVKEILPQNVVLDTDDGAGDGIIFRNRMLDKTLQRCPGAAAEGGKKFPIVEKRTAEDFRYAEYEMPVRNLLEDIHAEPLQPATAPVLGTWIAANDGQLLNIYTPSAGGVVGLIVTDVRSVQPSNA